MSPKPPQLSLGQRIAWHRLRRGLSQEVLAGLVGRTSDWLGKVENDRAPLDRLSVIRSLAVTLGVPLKDLVEDLQQSEPRSELELLVEEVRSSLMDYRLFNPLFPVSARSLDPPNLRYRRSELEMVMSAYQASDYQRVLRRLPELLTQAQAAARFHDDEHRNKAQTLLALASQSCAMILTKIGETDLAWIATERGLTAAFESGDLAVQGSLMRSGVHSLHSRGEHGTAVAMAEEAVSHLRKAQRGRATDPRMLSVYGTLLLPSAVAAARQGDRASASDYLNEAERVAERLGKDANHLWTAFGPTNVALHRVTVASSLGDPRVALELGLDINASRLPLERRVRHLLELAVARVAVNEIDSGVDHLLQAEGLASSHVHGHVMSHQIVERMMRSKQGRRDRRLANLAHRMGML